ncbi:unnamed protein product [Allacma fusca]|uniref:Uncharacterized protein n=1 Tax=Allacma fusca TaxID=39272 RepID=A0A8J2NQP3_9HEXA|nr:unnamed protein product [Allacma fusca]
MGRRSNNKFRGSKARLKEHGISTLHLNPYVCGLIIIVTLPVRPCSSASCEVITGDVSLYSTGGGGNRKWEVGLANGNLLRGFDL